MKKCPYCNAQMSDIDLFCSACGKAFPKGDICPRCGEILNEGDVFCSNCGTKIHMIEEHAHGDNLEDTITEAKHEVQKVTEAPSAMPISPSPSQTVSVHDEEEDYSDEASPKKYGKWIVISLIAIALIGVGAYFFLNRSSNEEQEEIVEIVADGSRTLCGTIGDIPITMELHIENPNVDGSMYYNKYGPSNKLFVSGSLNNNEIELIEHNKDGMETGRYKGKYSNGVFQGEYVNYKGDTYPFYLSETEKDTEEVVEEPFETALVSYKDSVPCNNGVGIRTEINIDYPIKGNSVLKEAVTGFILNSLNKAYTELSYGGDTSDGQAVVNFYGKNRIEAFIETGAGDDAINIKKEFETDKLISYNVDYGGWGGGAGWGYFFGATFNKSEGKIVHVIKDPNNYEFKSALIQYAKNLKRKGEIDYADEEFEEHPYPNEEPYITKDGVCFNYQKYEIGFGYMGYVSFTIPFDKLRPYMSETALSLIEGLKQNQVTEDYQSDSEIQVREQPSRNDLSQSIADYVNSRLKNQYRNCSVDKSSILLSKDSRGNQMAVFAVDIGDMEYYYSVENIQLNPDGSVQQANIVSNGVMPLIENYGYDVQFMQQSDVWSYVRGHKFKSSSGTILEVRGTNLYFNGTQVSSGLRVEMQQGIYSTAHLVSSNAYLWVNGSRHEISNMVDGITYKEVK